MKLSDRRARANEASQAASREAMRRNLTAAVEGLAGAALDMLRVYETGNVTPAQNAEFGAMLERMRAELAPLAEPLDKARAVLDALDTERAAYA